MTEKKPEETTIDEGLAKLHEASEQLTEQQLDALAQAAKNAAQESRREAQPTTPPKTGLNVSLGPARFSGIVAPVRSSAGVLQRQ